MSTVDDAPPQRRWAPLAVGLLTVAGSVLALWPDWGPYPERTATSVLVAGSYVALGVRLGSDPTQRATGRIFAVAGLLWIVDWLNCWHSGPWPLLSWLLGPLSLVFGAWGLLRYPLARLTRARTILLWVSTLDALGGSLLIALTSRPQWHGFRPDTWWPTLWPHQGWQDGFVLATNIFAMTAIAIVPFAMYRRADQLGGFARKVLTPTSYAAAAGPTVWIATSAALIFVDSTTAHRITDAIQGLALLAVPGSFFLVLSQRRRYRAAVIDLAVDVSRSESGLDVRAALRRTLGDDDLDLVHQESPTSWRNADGPLPGPPSPARQQLSITLTDTDGTCLGFLVLDRDVTAHPPVLDVATAIGRLGLQVARARYAEWGVRQDGVRIVQAVMAERQRIERLIHDGTQQPLLALNIQLERIRTRTDEPATSTALAASQDLLGETLADLRALARGMYPAVLTESGLGSALVELAERTPLPVRVEVPAQRLAADVEAAAYFVVSEALTNTLRHAEATRATVTASVVACGPDSHELAIVVADDGRGEARLTPGGGLEGLRDRLQLLGGDLTVREIPEGGSRVQARIPLQDKVSA